MSDGLLYALFSVVAIAIVVVSARRVSRGEKRARETFKRVVKELGAEPVSLHPSIDPNRCISIGACAKACPEGEVIGLVNGRAELVKPNACIGHGACAAACPVDAISLVFGTARRGVDIPYVKPTFETNVGALYIAGELGGMGLIRNAVTQGRQAMESIAGRDRSADRAVGDVLIVGAGPAGLSATLQAEKEGLRYVTVEQEGIGGTLLSYPRQKVVMTQPMEIPLYGKFNQREITKEELLDLWEEVVTKTGVAISTGERLESIERPNGYYEIETTKGRYRAKNVLLAIGRRGTPRKLGVPGEATSKVVYKLLEPEQYEGKRCLIVGGGDSAVEAALSLAKTPGTEVVVSYRKRAFGRIKDRNQERIDRAVEGGDVKVMWESQVVEITNSDVDIEAHGRRSRVANDYVFVFIGGELPTALLRSIGVEVQTRYGEG